MIPATHIEFNDDHTEAWLVLNVSPQGKTYPAAGVSPRADRPCDTCGGRKGTSGVIPYEYARWRTPCPDCDGTGRHTFTIDVDLSHAEMGCTKSEVLEGGGIWPTRTYRVSVVPDMVLPIIHNDNAPMLDGARFVEMWDDHHAIAWIDAHNDGRFILPSAAVRGMWAVKLAVQQ
jgi:hypothetical protein